MSATLINISFPISETFLVSMNPNQTELAREILFHAALALYRCRKLSLGKAAQLAGSTRLEFIERLQQKDEPIFDYTTAEMDEIFQDTLKLK